MLNNAALLAPANAKKHHHSLLHYANFANSHRKWKSECKANHTDPNSNACNAATNSVSANACTLDGDRNAVILHPIMPVKALSNNGTSATTYAFFDCGSSACFVSDELVRMHLLKYRWMCAR